MRHGVGVLGITLANRAALAPTGEGYVENLQGSSLEGLKGTHDLSPNMFLKYCTLNPMADSVEMG